MSDDTPYFAKQAITDTDCVANAINNLFGGPIVSRDSLLKMKRKNKKNIIINICREQARGGLFCENNIIEHILKLINNDKLKVPKKIKGFFEDTTAVTWYDLSRETKIKSDEFDTFFKDFHQHIIGIYGNKQITQGINHAVCVRRSTNGRYLWMLDSLDDERKRVSLQRLPVNFHKIQPFVVILKNFVPLINLKNFVPLINLISLSA